MRFPCVAGGGRPRPGGLAHPERPPLTPRGVARLFTGLPGVAMGKDQPEGVPRARPRGPPSAAPGRDGNPGSPTHPLNEWAARPCRPDGPAKPRQEGVAGGAADDGIHFKPDVGRWARNQGWGELACCRLAFSPANKSVFVSPGSLATPCYY